MSAWLHVVGVGEGGVAALPLAIRLIVASAETIIGPPRFLEGLEATLAATDTPRPDLANAEAVRRRNMAAIARALLEETDESEEPGIVRRLIEWRPPLDNMLGQVLRHRRSPTVILASGDPTWFGIGATLARHLEADEYDIVPHVSSLQLAAARMKWPLQDVTTISLHGRPAELIHPHLLPGNRILALTSDSTTALQVVEILANRGYSLSRMTALENLGSDNERISSAISDLFDGLDIGDFYVLAIECAPDTRAPLLPPLPGLPDDAFVNDGQLTKREVRAVSLAKLQPYPGALLWDVGAGCGSIAIEWMRAARGAEAIAFEREGERLQMIAVNAGALGVPSLRIESGDVPGTLFNAPPPDAIFLGGGFRDPAVFEVCWRALKPGGRMVANAVTVDGEAQLFEWQAEYGGELVRLDFAVLDTIGTQRVLRPRMPVLQWSVQKPTQSLTVILE